MQLDVCTTSTIPFRGVDLFLHLKRNEILSDDVVELGTVSVDAVHLNV